MAFAMPASASAAPLPQCAGTTIFVNGLGDRIQLPTVSNGSSNTTCLLGEGDVSPAVGALQNALNTCFNAGLSQDNHFGSLTKAALENAQRDEGVSVDGVYGPQTRNAMDWRNLSGRTRCIGLDGVSDTF